MTTRIEAGQVDREGVGLRVILDLDEPCIVRLSDGDSPPGWQQEHASGYHSLSPYVQGLSPGTEYTAEVLVGSETVASCAFRTPAEDEPQMEMVVETFEIAATGDGEHDSRATDAAICRELANRLRARGFTVTPKDLDEVAECLESGRDAGGRAGEKEPNRETR